MDDATLELYLQKIAEFVQDDDLIVTTELVCRKLKISIAETKLLIKQYLSDHRDIYPGALGVHYVILGKLNKEEKFCVLLVSEPDLTEKEALFKAGYTKEIYSIQKAKKSDINVLNLVDTVPRDTALLGSIVSKNCKATKKVASKTIPNVPKRKIESTKQESVPVSPEKKQKLDANLVLEKKGSPPKAKIANRPVQNGKGIASFFSKMTEKRKIEPKIDEKKSEVVETKSSDNEKKAVIAEEVEDTIEETPKKDKEIEKKNKETVKGNKKNKDYKLIDTDDEEVTLEPKREITQTKKNASAKKTTKKRGRKDESPGKPQKKRRRVVEPSNSDSEEDIFGNASASDGSDSEIINSSRDEPEPILKPNRIDPFAPKNKQKKRVDKSYVDEEGYMVTRKEWIAVSGSEDEEELVKQQENVVPEKAVVKKVDQKAVKKVENSKEDEKKPVATKGKGKNLKKTANQPSIMNFFSKK